MELAGIEDSWSLAESRDPTRVSACMEICTVLPALLLKSEDVSSVPPLTACNTTIYVWQLVSSHVLLYESNTQPEMPVLQWLKVDTSPNGSAKQGPVEHRHSGFAKTDCCTQNLGGHALAPDTRRVHVNGGRRSVHPYADERRSKPCQTFAVGH